MIHPGNQVCAALNNAYREWKNISVLDGKKYIFFEHHCEVYYGCTFVYNYNNHSFQRWLVTDEKKYMLFLLRWS